MQAKNERYAPAMSKAEILALPDYKRHAEFLDGIMEDRRVYSLREVDRALADHCKKRAG